MNLGVTELLIILAIVVLLFGTRRLRAVGGDLGEAVRNLRTAFRTGQAAVPVTESEKPRPE